MSASIDATSGTVYGHVLRANYMVDVPQITYSYAGSGRGGALKFDWPEVGILGMSDPNFTNFNRVFFGTYTSNSPALKRNGASLEITDAVGNSRATNNLIVPGVVISTNGFILPASTPFTAPASLSGQGAHLWSDGTNLCVVLQNSAGTRTTNKVTLTAWP